MTGHDRTMRRVWLVVAVLLAAVAAGVVGLMACLGFGADLRF